MPADTGANRLAGQVAIVTGAAYGIGYACAQRLACEGAHVVIADIKGHEVAARQLADDGLSAESATCDVTSDDDVSNQVAAIMAKRNRPIATAVAGS
jgi:NAD(P)-dependent dehydrogenase (short-subunit alcohol dehydrogenase family)